MPKPTFKLRFQTVKKDKGQKTKKKKKLLEDNPQ